MTPPDENPLVIVEWLDSVQPQSAWMHLEDFEKTSVVFCSSVGWMIEDDDVVAIFPNFGCLSDESNAQISGVVRIPKCSITKITKLKEI